MSVSFDSDTSFSAMTSPPLSPPRHGHQTPYMPSPSRESLQDSDSLSQSFSRATPRESPSASPLHPYWKQHFRQTSMDSLPFVAHTPRPWSRRVLLGNRPWAPSSTILKEEGGASCEKKVCVLRCCVVWVVVFFTGALLFWAATMPKAPHVIVQTVALSYFGLGDGVDNSGVPTMVASLNSTATLQIYNPSGFFGYHIQGSPLEYKYLDLTMAGSQLHPFYLPRKSTKNVVVAVTADKQFLHGAGPSFDGDGVTLKLEGTVLARAYVLSRKFSSHVTCTFKFAAGGPAQWKVQRLACPIVAAS